MALRVLRLSRRRPPIPMQSPSDSPAAGDFHDVIQISTPLFPPFSPVIPAKAGIQRAAPFVRIRIYRIGGIHRISLSPNPAPFAITENPANPNTNKRLPNPENPITPQIPILTKPRRVPSIPIPLKYSTIALHNDNNPLLAPLR